MNGYNLDLKNPCAPADLEHLSPGELAADVIAKEEQILLIMRELQAMRATVTE